MSEDQDAVCFTCGQPSGDLLRLNTLPNGQVCPTCRDRLLEGIPAALPGEEAKPSESKHPFSGSAEDFEDQEGSAPFQMLASRGPGQLLRGGGPVEPA